MSAHNKLRALHQNTGPLVWDDQLAAKSQQWANHLANLGGLSHDGNANAGENLYGSRSWGTPPKGSNSAKAVLSWYVIMDFYKQKTYEHINHTHLAHDVVSIFQQRYFYVTRSYVVSTG